MMIICLCEFLYLWGMNFGRFNSTIKPKIGLCVDCKHDVEQHLVSGRCPYHYQKHRASVREEKAKNKPQPVKDFSKKVSGGPSALVLWYADRIAERTGRCMECGEVIPLIYAHSACAHVVPKNLFRSVATHPLNAIELGPQCGCHGRYDHSWERASKMNVFKEAKERFRQFQHLIAPEERRRIPDCLLD